MEDASVNTFVNVSWRFGVTVASSGTDEVGKNFLQLKFLYNEDGKIKSIFTEMNINQFYKLLHDLEKAKNTL
ncbi:PREDICTED: COMM domain-containing protein 7-like, partial [Ceratosolen solmsi marchali]|uniref:COMM domain-containing protein 7-like n=1 Tax=Ceratosolen solmsi marchali TaxID=326594 RepID=A0AAJ6YV14_9HYME